jgi:hypothetical protein
MSGFNKYFKDGAGGLKGGSGNASGGFQSSEKRSSAASVWDDSVPVAYWNFEDGSGTTLSDVSSAGNSNLDGDLGGTANPTWDTSNKVRGSSSLLFAGGSSTKVTIDDDTGNLDNTLDFNADDAFTLSTWFKIGTYNALGTQGSLMAKMTQTPVGGETAYVGYDLYLVEDGSDNFKLTFLLYKNGSAYLWVWYNTGISDHDWHHAVMTYDGPSGAELSSVKLYVDGSLVTSTQKADTLGDTDLTSNKTDYSFGARKNSQYFDGNLDECAVWDKVLSADEVTDVYNDGSGADLTDGIPKS